MMLLLQLVGGGIVDLSQYEMVIDGVSEILDYAYGNIFVDIFPTKLKSLYIGNSVSSIGMFAFSGCGSLTSLTIGNSVTSIGDWAFYYCRSLTSLTIPNSVTSIGDYAFSDCISLTSLTIPNSVTSIGYWTFSNCPSSCAITFDKPKAQVSSMGNYPWKIDSGAVISCTDGNLTVS